jgi:hypothetical protein
MAIAPTSAAASSAHFVVAGIKLQGAVWVVVRGVECMASPPFNRCSPMNFRSWRIDIG